MTWLLQFQDGPYNGKYLVRFDPDFNEGAGLIVATEDLEQAARFESAMEAMDQWKRQSTVTPLRFDGKPNRPMSAWSVKVEKQE